MRGLFDDLRWWEELLDVLRTCDRQEVEALYKSETYRILERYIKEMKNEQ